MFKLIHLKVFISTGGQDVEHNSRNDLIASAVVNVGFGCFDPYGICLIISGFFNTLKSFMVNFIQHLFLGLT